MKKVITVFLVLTMAFSLFGCSLSNQNEFAIKIVVPAGSQEEFVFSHEEISPKSDSITIMADGDFPDTEVVLKTVEVKEENAYEPSYITHGMPVEMTVEKGAWFKVGLNIQNDTDEDQTYTLIIKPVEVRIEDNSNELVNKTFVYEKGGFAGANDEFFISLKEDGTFNLSEGGGLSVMHRGTWSLENNILSLIQPSDKGEIVNYFKAEKNTLIFQEENSSNSWRMKLADGEKFIEALPLEIEKVRSESIREEAYPNLYIADEEGDYFTICSAHSEMNIRLFRFVSVESKDTENGIQYSVKKELYHVDKLEKPFLLKLCFAGLLPTYGVVFEDADQNDRLFTINMSGIGEDEGNPYYLEEVKTR